MAIQAMLVSPVRMDSTLTSAENFSVSAVSLPVTGRYDGHGLQPDVEIKVYETVDVSALAALRTGTAIGSGSVPEQILALEQRLALLGFLDSADGAWDDATREALAAVYTGMGQSAQDNALPALLRALEAMTEETDGASVHTDAALEAALALAAEDAAA